ncbi:MAG: PAS domain S-box protein [Archangiaceae bacterium]|nr:PAS domain S-box protein [Archangiaceae bacterium]
MPTAVPPQAEHLDEVLRRERELQSHNEELHRANDAVRANLLAVKLARDALLSSEARYRELFESGPEGIFVATADGCYTEVNAAGCRLLGYRRDELIGRSITEFVRPAELARQAVQTRHILEGGSEVSEWSLRRKDGTFVAVEMSVNTLPDGHMRAFVHDITDRHRAEEALRVSEAKFSGIVSFSSDAIVSVDESQRITMWNDGATHVFGYSKSEALGAPLDLIIPERLRSRHREHVAIFADGHEREAGRRMGTRSTPIIGLRKNGEEFAADAAISRLDVGGARVLTVTLRDTSERERIADEEHFLAEIGNVLVSAGSDHRRFLAEVAELIVRNIADWCVIDVVEGGALERLKVAHSDPTKAAACAELERQPIHQRPNAVSEVVGSKRPLLVGNVTEEYLEARSLNAEHLRLIKALEPTSFIIAPLVARGVTLGTLAFGSSRGSRRLGSNDLAQAERLASRVALATDNARAHQEAQQAVKARDEVLGIVAHDLRNPLSNIVLQAQRLLRPRGQVERRNQKTSENIRSAALRMNELIQDLLDVARLEGGERLSIARAEVDPAGLLADAAEHSQAELTGAGASLEVAAGPDLPHVSADRRRLLQVFSNLVGNAAKFSRGRITVGAKARERQVLFWVADDGVGIPADAVPHVFDRFWQASRSDRRGAGLGLSIVKAIVEAHGGSVWVESEVDVGTTFFFTVPCVEGHR